MMWQGLQQSARQRMAFPARSVTSCTLSWSLALAAAVCRGELVLFGVAVHGVVMIQGLAPQATDQSSTSH